MVALIGEKNEEKVSYKSENCHSWISNVTNFYIFTIHFALWHNWKKYILLFAVDDKQFIGWNLSKKEHQGMNLSGLGNGKNVWTKVYKLIECLLSCLKLSEIAKFDENYKN